MYEKYWSLNDRPFRNTPDPHYLCFTRQHEEGLTRMLYAIIEGHGAMMLTGDYGCGKTLLTHILIDELDPARFELALVRYPHLAADDLLREIMRQFGYETAGMDKGQVVRLLQDFLLFTHNRGARAIVIIDEAQMVADRSALEEIRLLLNFQQDRRFLLTLFLVGQPELRQRIADLPQLQERLSIRYHIGAFDEEESLRYLAHRLEIAGGTHEIFTREAERLLVAACQGIPRRINNVADLSLLVGYGQQAPVVDEEIVQRVLMDMEV